MTSTSLFTGTEESAFITRDPDDFARRAPSGIFSAETEYLSRPIATLPSEVIVTTAAAESGRCELDARGASTPIASFSANTIVTMKKISRMKITSMSGDMLIADAGSSSSNLGLRRLMPTPPRVSSRTLAGRGPREFLPRAPTRKSL